MIGAGYTGLSAALYAAEAGARVIVLEAQEAGFGASGRNGGQVHTGWRKEQRELERWLGPLHARELWNLSEEAKALVQSLVARHAIACEWKAGLVLAAHNGRAARELEADAENLSRIYGYTALRMLSAGECARETGANLYSGGRLDRSGGHLHPLLYARGLARAAEAAGAEVFEHSAVLDMQEGRNGVELRCPDGQVSAGRAILATDSSIGSLAPVLDRTIAPVESFVTATAPLPDSLANSIVPRGVAVADTRHVLDYYRKSLDGRLLFAGREAYLGKPSDSAALVRPRLIRVFPQLREIPIEYAWSGTVAITATRMPHFGNLGQRILFGYGYSGQGVALATLGGNLLAEAALGHRERFDVVARVPPRTFPGGRHLKRPLVAAAMLAFKLADLF